MTSSVKLGSTVGTRSRAPLGDGKKHRVASKLVFQPLHSDTCQSVAPRPFQCSCLSRTQHLTGHKSLEGMEADHIKPLFWRQSYKNEFYLLPRDR